MDMGIVYFIIAFIVGMIWFRILFSIFPSYAKKPLTRNVLKVQWHHLHYGALFMLVGSVLLLFTGQTPLTTILLGLGLGLIMDLFIPSLLLETDRKQELIVYHKSLLPTILLFAAIIVIVVILALIFIT